VNGTMRAETGLSLGGNATLSVDAPGVLGGRFTVLPNGNVGINNPNPFAALDVNGTVRINGDIPMSSNPHMFFSGSFPGSFCGDASCGNISGGGINVPGGAVTPDRSILITKISFTFTDSIDLSCVPAEVGIVINPQFFPPFAVAFPLPKGLSAPQGVDFPVSPPLLIPAGSRALVSMPNQGSHSCSAATSGGGNGFANVEYVMQ
jgi:hypothetical protein